MIKIVGIFAAFVAALAVATSSGWLSPTYESLGATWRATVSGNSAEAASSGPGPLFTTAPIERRRLVSSVSATGSLAPVALVSVSSELSGQVKEIYADFNKGVKRGEPIALIDPVTFEITVEQAKADLDVAEASVTMQQAMIDRMSTDIETVEHDLESAGGATELARVRMDEAAADYERKRELSSISVADREHSRFGYLAAQAQLRSAEALELSKRSTVASAEAQLRSGRAQLINLEGVVRQKQATLRQAEFDLERTVIRAPVDGTIIARNVEDGQTVAVSLQAPTLFTIAQDLRAMQINTAISEAEIGRIRIGQRVEFTVDAYPGRAFSGEVIQIRQQPQTTQNVVTYTVVATAPNPDLLLMPGMTATTNVIVEEMESALTVPNAALRFRPPGEPKSDESRVYVERDERIDAAPVEAGLSDGSFTAITSDELQAGDKAVTGLAFSGDGKPSPSEWRLFGIF